MAPLFTYGTVIVSDVVGAVGLDLAHQLVAAFPQAAVHLLAPFKDKGDKACQQGGVTVHLVDWARVASGDTAGCAGLCSALASSASKAVLFVHSATAMGPAGACGRLALADIASACEAVQVRAPGSTAQPPLPPSTCPQHMLPVPPPHTRVNIA